MPIAILNDDVRALPNPLLGGEDGIVAVGGDLAPERLIHAYRTGIFPGMAKKDQSYGMPLTLGYVITPDKFRTQKCLREYILK